MRRHVFWIVWHALFIAWNITYHFWWLALVLAFLLGMEVQETVEDLIKRRAAQ